MAIDFSEVKKLAPELRVKELRKLIIVLRKVIEEHQDQLSLAEKLLENSEKENLILEETLEKDAEKRNAKKDTKKETKETELENIVQKEAPKPRPQEEQKRKLEDVYKEATKSGYSATKSSYDKIDYTQRDEFSAYKKSEEERKRRDEEREHASKAYKQGKKHLKTTSEELAESGAYKSGGNDRAYKP